MRSLAYGLLLCSLSLFAAPFKGDGGSQDASMKDPGSASASSTPSPQTAVKKKKPAKKSRKKVVKKSKRKAVKKRAVKRSSKKVAAPKGSSSAQNLSKTAVPTSSSEKSSAMKESNAESKNNVNEESLDDGGKKEALEKNLNDDFALDSLKTLDNGSIYVVSDLGDKLSEKEKAKRKADEKALKEKEDKEKKEADDKKEKDSKDSDSSQSEKKKKEEGPPFFKRDKIYHWQYIPMGYRVPRDILFAEPFVYKNALYALVKDGRLENKLYLVDANTFGYKLIEGSLPFNVANSKVFVFNEKIYIIEKTMEKTYNLYSKENVSQAWQNLKIDFRQDGLEDKKESAPKGDSTQKASDKKEEKENLLDFDMQKSFVLVYRSTVFFFTNKGNIFFSHDLKTFYPLVKKAPWLGEDLYYPLVYKDKLYVFGTLGGSNLISFTSEDGLIWGAGKTEADKVLPLRPGFQVVATPNKLYLFGGRELSLLEHGEQNFKLYEDSIEKQRKQAEQEAIKKQLEAQKKLLDEKKTAKEKEEEEKDLEAKKKDQEGFVFADSEDPNDMRPDLVDEKLYEGSSREIKHPNKKMNRLDNNSIKLEPFLKESLKGLGIFSSSDAIVWRHVSDDFSHAYNVRVLNFKGRLLSFSYQGLMTEEFTYSPSTSNEGIIWKARNDEEKEEADDPQDQGSIYRVLKENVYQIKKDGSAHVFYIMDEENQKKKMLGRVEEKLDWIGSDFFEGLPLAHGKKLWFFNPKENSKEDKMIDLPFDIENLITTASSGKALYFLVKKKDGSSAVYRYENKKVTEVGSFLQKMNAYGAVFLSDELFIMGGEDEKGLALNEVWSTKDFKLWKKVDDFEMQVQKKLKSKSSEDASNETSDEEKEADKKPPERKKVFLERFSPRKEAKVFTFKGDIYLVGGIYGLLHLSDVWKTRDGKHWQYQGSMTQGSGNLNFKPENLLTLGDKMLYFDGFDGNVRGNFSLKLSEKPGVSLEIYGEEKKKNEAKEAKESS